MAWSGFQPKALRKYTPVGANLFGSSAYVASLLPSREARYFRKFVEETNPEVREKILDIVPDETREALQAQWAKQRARIEAAEGQHGELGSDGKPYSEEDVEEYEHARTGLSLGNYLRSRQIARFFFTRRFSLPDDPDSAAYDSDLD